MLLPSSTLYAESKLDNIEVRQDPSTKEYILKELAFTELWAYLLFLEGRETDLMKDLEDAEAGEDAAIALSEKILNQSDGLIKTIKGLEITNLALMETNADLSNQYSTFEVVLITSFGVAGGIGIGFLIGALYK